MTTKLVTKKHVSLVPYKKDGKRAFKLLGPIGEILPFTVFSDRLLSSPFNTRRTYCHHLADFFDYFYEASFHMLAKDESKLALTKSDLRRIIECWHDYLVIGPSSGKDLVQSVSATLPSPLCLHNTSAGKHAALNLFLKLSEQLREEAVELTSLGLLSEKLQHDVTPLFQEINHTLKISSQVQSARLSNSMLAGVVASRKTADSIAKITEVSQIVVYDPAKAFPLEKAVEFIESLPTYRDKTIYSFYAASGCRSNEGLQLLLEDIRIDPANPSNNRVLLINPKTRLNHPSYLALTPEDRDRLAWKGRQTNMAFLIEPFASMFFQNLQRYLSEEYYPHNRHSFLFQILKVGAIKGRPYFLTSAQSRQQIFDVAARRVELSEDVEGAHGFRHMYGTYLLNYFPRGSGDYGLPMGLVRVMLGHKKISSTEKYAIYDQDLIQSRLSLASNLLFQNGTLRSFADQKLDAMRSQLTRFEAYVSSQSKGQIYD